MKNGEICTVEIELTKPFKVNAWVLAKIIECQPDDSQGNWEILRVQVIGETYQRDAYDGRVMRIETAFTQAAAVKLVERQNGQFKAYMNQDALRKAITTVIAETD